MSLWITHALLMVLSFSVKTDANICCAPDQWEGVMYLDYMQVFIDANTLFLYFNGTVNVSYDYSNERAFFSMVGTEISPLIPKPEPMNKTNIIDFKNNVVYDISGTACQKQEIGENMTRECVTDGDIVQSSGKIASGIMTDTYIMTLSENFNNVRGTIQRGSCLPVHMVYLIGSDNPDSGAVTNLDVLNIEKGIKNPKIFDPPASCKPLPIQQPTKSLTMQKVIKELFYKRVLFG